MIVASVAQRIEYLSSEQVVEVQFFPEAQTHGDVGVAVTRQLVELELGVRLPYISPEYENCA